MVLGIWHGFALPVDFCWMGLHGNWEDMCCFHDECHKLCVFELISSQSERRWQVYVWQKATVDSFLSVELGPIPFSLSSSLIFPLCLIENGGHHWLGGRSGQNLWFDLTIACHFAIFLLEVSICMYVWFYEWIEWVNEWISTLISILCSFYFAESQEASLCPVYPTQKLIQLIYLNS